MANSFLEKELSYVKHTKVLDMLIVAHHISNLHRLSLLSSIFKWAFFRGFYFYAKLFLYVE